MLGIRVVDRNDRELQHAFLRHRAQADDAGCGLFRSADDVFESIRPLGVQNRHQVGSIVHRDVRLVIDRGQNMVVVGVVVLALDGVNGNVVVAYQAGGHVILCGQRIRGA
jgi:hypothetical protein